MKDKIPEKEILDHISNFMRRLTDQDIYAIRTGRAKIAVVRNPEPKVSRPESDQPRFDIASLVDEIHSAETREEAMVKIHERKLRGEDLRNLAKHLDIATSRSETLGKLAEKIVESTVGFRLRSQAIRGTATDSTSSGHPVETDG
ncbi:hypothetical protein RCF19_22820 [Rhodococcus qingshengii]